MSLPARTSIRRSRIPACGGIRPRSCRNQPLAFGNAGKGILRIPGRAQWDFSMYKSFQFGEKYSAQFRFEAFNFTNTPQFFAPNTRVGNRNFGIISGAGTPRNLQLGIKFIF